MGKRYNKNKRNHRHRKIKRKNNLKKAKKKTLRKKLTHKMKFSNNVEEQNENNNKEEIDETPIDTITNPTEEKQYSNDEDDESNNENQTKEYDEQTESTNFMDFDLHSQEDIPIGEPQPETTPETPESHKLPPENPYRMEENHENKVPPNGKENEINNNIIDNFHSIESQSRTQAKSGPSSIEELSNIMASVKKQFFHSIFGKYLQFYFASRICSFNTAM